MAADANIASRCQTFMQYFLVTNGISIESVLVYATDCQVGHLGSQLGSRLITLVQMDGHPVAICSAVVSE